MRSAGSFVATALSIPLLAAVPARACISPRDCSRWPRRAALGRRGTGRRSRERSRGVAATRRAAARARGSRRGATAARGAGFSGVGFGGLGFGGLARFVRRGVGSPATARRPAAAAAFLFAYRVMPTAMVTFTAFTYARFSMPDSYRAGLLLVSMGGGVWLGRYRRVAPRALLSAAFVVGAFADAVLGLGRLIVVQADRRRDGGDGGRARADGCAGRQRRADVVRSDDGVHARVGSRGGAPRGWRRRATPRCCSSPTWPPAWVRCSPRS